MIFTPTILSGSYVIEPRLKSDNRGWFMRTYCADEFDGVGHTLPWVQINHSFTAKKGTIRGMHFLQKPAEEVKLVRCIAGSVLDVIVDLREASPTYLQWFGTELSCTNNCMMYIPAGFAHGFQTLEDNTELIYHHTEKYLPELDRGVRYNDPVLNIDWPMAVSMVSEKDQSFPLINDRFKSTF